MIANSTRESHVIRAGQQLHSEDILDVVEQLWRERDAPVRIQIDNGSQCASIPMDRWAQERGVVVNLSRPGKPTGQWLASGNREFPMSAPAA